VNRRAFITLLCGAAAPWPLALRAQQSERMRRIGVLMGWPESDPEARSERAAFVQALQKLGWTDGGNLRIETRWAAPSDPESMHRLAKACRACARPHSFAKHPRHHSAAARDAHHPRHFRDCCRSDRQRLRRELPATRRQRYRFRRCGADAGWQMGRTPQGDCATGDPGRCLVQPCNGDICRILVEALQGRRSVLWSGGDTRPCPQHVRT